MMNQNIRRTFFVALVAVLVFPFTHAEAIVGINPLLKNINLSGGKLDLPPVKKIKNTEEFCTKFSETANALVGDIAKQQVKTIVTLADYDNASKKGRDARDASLKENRDKADQKRNDWYKRLEDKADTDAKKNAVVLFKQTVDTAVDTRYKAVDTAIEAFRKGVADAILARKSSMQSTESTFASSVDTEIAAVKTYCDNGSTTGAIRANFRMNLKAARDTLGSDKKNMDKVGIEVKSLAIARQEEVKKSVATFQTTLKTAIADLKKAFGEQ